jgi:23S rRNA (uracil1939-C5)-methyltransferase
MSIILATESARRKELFKKITEDFNVIPSGVNEKNIKKADPLEFAVEAAVLKAKKVGEKYPEDIILGADTVVSLNDKIMGKPADYAHAKKMLKELSGSKHKVITGVALYKADEDKLITGYEISYVEFKTLSEKEIESYLENNDYADKAGAYAVQEVGDKFVENLHGSYDNVVGLPVKRTKKLLEKFFAPEFVVEIKDIAFPKNWAVGQKDHFIIFVPGAVYGDKVKIRESKDSKNFSFGEIIKIEKPSPYRQKAECPFFGLCGGCALQNLDYRKQLELKENYLLKTLSKIGGEEMENVKVNSIVPSPDTFYYRNKMEFAFGWYGGQTGIGLRQRSSPFGKNRRNIIALDRCLIFSESVNKIFPVFLDFIKATELAPYDTMKKEGFFRHLVIKEGKNTGELMIIMVTRSRQNLDVTALVEKLIEKVPEVKSFYWVENDRLSDSVVFEKKNHLYGGTFINEKLGGFNFKMYPQSFFQPNTKGAEILYDKIAENVKSTGSRKILGLYSGPGTIEIYLSPLAEKVTGIDSENVNIHNAEENCKINGIENCKFYQGYVEKILQKKSFKGYDLLLVDPPRAGISKKAMGHILKLDIPNVICVSCNPATLARDLQRFKDAGYRLKELYAFDFFPHTTHLESMAVLEKN